jgi:hypothetical protein
LLIDAKNEQVAKAMQATEPCHCTTHRETCYCRSRQ